MLTYSMLTKRGLEAEGLGPLLERSKWCAQRNVAARRSTDAAQPTF